MTGPKRRMAAANFVSASYSATSRFISPITLGSTGSRFCRRSSSEAASERRDRKSTRLNSSHGYISYAVFCLKKKNTDYEGEYALNVLHFTSVIAMCTDAI